MSCHPQDQPGMKGSRRMRLGFLQYLCTPVLLAAFLAASLPSAAQGGFQSGPPSRYQEVLARLEAMTSAPVREWRVHADDLSHPENPSLDDASWTLVTLAGGFGRRQGQKPAGGPGGGPGW